MNNLKSYTNETLLAEGTKRLKNSNVNSPALDSRILLSYATSYTHEELILKRKEQVSHLTATKFFRLIERRIKHEPVAYIIKAKEFYGINFEVNKNVLIPRPESETLIDLAQSYSKSKSNFLDLGTGSGCLILTLLKIFPNSTAVGIDVSSKALQLAKKNTEQLHLSNRTRFIKSNWFNLKIKEKFDFVISNPPYIKSKDIITLQKDIRNYEPIIALDGGKDGLSCYKKIFSKLKSFLKLDGICIFEIGDKQFKSISKIASEYKFRVHKYQKDLSGKIRAVAFILM